MDLVRYDNNGLELLIDTNTGEVFASQNGFARMVGVSKPAISNWVGVNQIPLKNAEVLTPGGLQGVNLLDERAMLTGIAKYKPELIMSFAQAGLRLYLHAIAGYSHNNKVERSNEPKISRALKASREIKQIHENTEYISPRLAQYLIDHCVCEVLEENPQLTGPKLRGVVEIAEEMGLPINLKNRSQLGKHVKACSSQEPRKEERLVNGTMRKVAVYEDTEDIRRIIRNYFER